jgi:hypothetical protein
VARKVEKLVIADDPKDFTHVVIDPRDRNAIRQFFIEYDGLTTGELGVLCNRSNQTIRHWKHLITFEMDNNPFKKNHATAKRVELECVTDPKIWNNREWFYDQYVVKKRGKRMIARIIQRSGIHVYNKLKEFKIEIRKFRDVVRSNNPHCSEAWLYYHYATREEYLEWCAETNTIPDTSGGKGWGLVACAKAAGVVPYTIFNWLTKFKMHIRDLGTAAINGHQKLNKKNAEHLLGKTESQHPTISAPIKSA